jgi:ATP-dependent helicase/nuclease subunit B
MAVMVKLNLDGADSRGAASDPWPLAVALAISWSREHQVALRDAVFLVPFAQHLPLARRAWAAFDTWMPQVETTQTLAHRSAPAAQPGPDDIRFDAALDVLTARRLLRGQAVFARWLKHDPRSFAQAADALVDTAQAMLRSLACLPPAERAAHGAVGRAALGAASGVGGAERHLARIAFEWAMACAAPATDVLFALRPSAWIVVQAGGIDGLAHHLVQSAAGGADSADPTPALWINTDPAGDDPIASVSTRATVQVSVASSFEDEAERATAQVLCDLATHGAPVALIAQDRLLVRRISALLRRQGVPIRDETGWTLSTTRAAASVVLLLRAASAQATTDEVLDAITCWPAAQDMDAVASLEAALHRHQWARPTQVNPQRLPANAAALWSHAAHAVESLRGAGAQPWAAWLARLLAALRASGLALTLAADAAGQQVLAALHLPSGSADDADAATDRAESWTLADATRWVEATLEKATFVPTAPDAPAVIVTPAARAMLRPFAAVVWPGADDRRLGALPPPHSLLKDAELAALRLPTVAERQQREAVAFAQLLQRAPVTLLWRTDDDGEPLSASRFIERWVSAARDAGVPASAAAAERRVRVAVVAQPVARPLPAAPDLLPARLSASASESLRVCPYQFFALRMLQLQPAEELDGDLQKRDYGTWLHAVLHHFHTHRAPQVAVAAAPPDDLQALQAAASKVHTDMGFDAADFLPFAATFERFAPRYLTWLHERDRNGTQWLDGERDWTAYPEAWAGIAMHGVIDRIDSVRGAADAGPTTQLIDYKTGSTGVLRDKVKQPLEDTQLPFYAALAMEQGRLVGDIGPLDAMYLSLDDAKKIEEVRHPDVQRSATALVAGIGRDLARLRDGAALPALGEGSACGYCAARGLCRRDQWAATPAASAQGAP